MFGTSMLPSEICRSFCLVPVAAVPCLKIVGNYTNTYKYSTKPSVVKQTNLHN